MQEIKRIFTAKDGLRFERQEDGGVIITLTDQDNYLLSKVRLDKYHWCSLIADMSYYGEEDYGFDRASNFHYKKELNPITTPLKDKPNIFRN